MSLVAALRAMDPNITVDVTWSENRWRPVDPEGDGQPTAFEVSWSEETRGHDGPEPFGVDGPLDELLPLVSEILGYDNLLRGEGIRIEISGWALTYRAAEVAS